VAPELEEHVQQLADELGVIVIPSWVGELADECDLLPCGAAGEIHFEDEHGGALPVIWVSEEPSTAEAYLVALHELGHHATPAPGPCSELIEAEERAWLWAEQHALIPITPHLRAFIEGRLDSYRD
jgi:hypothetical protein